MASSLHHKTIRPGSLNGYSYYYSGRRPVSRPPARRRQAKPLSTRLKVGLVVGLFLVVGYFGYSSSADTGKQPVAAQDNSSSQQQAPLPAPVAAPAGLPQAQPASKPCEGNTHGKLIKVSVSQTRLWACEGTKQVHEAPVIVGLRGHAETETPPGTYHIYGKQKDTRLTGKDSRGAWDYPVHYWMPFLDNQHGTYGFHDATWRADNEFGNTSPDSEKASHGCVELPLASQEWLYNWAPVKTTVIVES